MIWLKNAWYVAGFADELTASNTVARQFLGESVVMMRHSNGQVVAMEDKCPHRLLPLSAGTRVGDELQCGYHGMRFSVEGKCTLAPGQTHIPVQACVKTYPLQQRHGLLWIWMGNPQKADPDLIPDMHWNDDPEWTPARGYHYIECDFRLSVDNLMDLGHESWVHLRTIGQGEEECIPSFPVKVSLPADGLVRCHREMPNIEPPPFFAMVLNHHGRINRWQTAISLAPSICMTDFGVFPVGTSPDDAFRTHVLHLLTPETEATTHYFWFAARNRRLDEPSLTDGMQQGISQTFDEDAVVLKLQQQAISRYGGNIPGVAMKVDEAPIRARRVLDGLVQKELADPDFVYRPPLMIEDVTPALEMA